MVQLFFSSPEVVSFKVKKIIEVFLWLEEVKMHLMTKATTSLTRAAAASRWRMKFAKLGSVGSKLSALLLVGKGSSAL